MLRGLRRRVTALRGRHLIRELEATREEADKILAGGDEQASLGVLDRGLRKVDLSQIAQFKAREVQAAARVIFSYWSRRLHREASSAVAAANVFSALWPALSRHSFRESLEFLNVLSGALTVLGRDGEWDLMLAPAEFLCERVAGLDGAGGEVLCALGDYLAGSGDHSSAGRWYQLAWEKGGQGVRSLAGPRLALLLAKTALAALHGGNLPEAASVLQKALEYAPGDKEYELLAAAAEAMAGDLESASSRISRLEVLSSDEFGTDTVPYRRAWSAIVPILRSGDSPSAAELAPLRDLAALPECSDAPRRALLGLIAVSSRDTEALAEICQMLRAAYGEEWPRKAPPTPWPYALAAAARALKGYDGSTADSIIRETITQSQTVPATAQILLARAHVLNAVKAAREGRLREACAPLKSACDLLTPGGRANALGQKSARDKGNY